MKHAIVSIENSFPWLPVLLIVDTIQEEFVDFITCDSGTSGVALAQAR